MDRVLVSYGCGDDGKKFLMKCKENEIVIDYICDGNRDLVGQIFVEYEIKSVDYLRNDTRAKIVIITSRRYYYDILKSLDANINDIIVSIDEFFYFWGVGCIDKISSYDVSDINSHFFKNISEYFLTKDKICLFADAVLLEPEKNAGAKASLCYINALVNKGWNVVFYSSLSNYYPNEAVRLEKLGCIVLWGYNRKSQILDFIAKNIERIELLFINRPEVFEELHAYINNTKARIIYYGHDVHYLRLQREFEITGDNNLLHESECIRKIEFRCIERADLSGYPSIYEVEILRRELPQCDIRYLPLYSYDDREIIKYEDDRSGIMFVGGFAHRPNVDAMKWFCNNVMPMIRKAGVKDLFYIIGSNPSKEIWDLSSNGINVVGFVSDEELERYYRKCRLAVVPLRYGAGMKGKLLEAMYNGIPIVTTSIGAEGLDIYKNCFEVADNEIDFADRIVFLLRNQEYAKQLSINAQYYIRENFNDEKFERCLEGYI